MRIELDENYVLTGDSDQVTLSKVHVAASGKRAGEIIVTPAGYYRDVPQALEAYAKRVARESDASTLGEYIAALKGVRDHIQKLVGDAA